MSGLAAQVSTRKDEKDEKLETLPLRYPMQRVRNTNSKKARERKGSVRKLQGETYFIFSRITMILLNHRAIIIVQICIDYESLNGLYWCQVSNCGM